MKPKPKKVMSKKAKLHKALAQIKETEANSK